MTVGLIPLLTDCASSPPQAKTAGPPAQIVDGPGTDSERTMIQNTDSQIYQAEHAGDPETPTISGQNQGIP